MTGTDEALIERVAKAIFQDDLALECADPDAWNVESTRAWYLSNARAAIAAMQPEPSDKQREDPTWTQRLAQDEAAYRRRNR